MPSKPLTIMIPEPGPQDSCNEECPLFAWNDGYYCGSGLHKNFKSIDFVANIKPGPKCPQYQGDKPC